MEGDVHLEHHQGYFKVIKISAAIVTQYLTITGSSIHSWGHVH